MTHQFTVSEAEAGRRLDKWLVEKLPDYSRKQVKALLDDGRVLINGRRVVIAGWELRDEDEVEVRFPPGGAPDFAEEEGDEGEADAPKGAKRAHPRHPDSPTISASIDRHIERRKRHRQRREEERAAERGKRGKRSKGKDRGEPRHGRLKIHHEDRDIIVVEKPAGIPVTGGRRRGGKRSRGGENLATEVRRYLQRKHPDAKGVNLTPLHRLDTGTSGVIVFALSKKGEKLTQAFRNHKIRREYAAVVEGRVERENGVIDRALEKGDFGGGKKVRESKEGKRAITEYRVAERYGNATLLDISLRTGRTHQIRAHFSSAGHPVVGDAVYGSGKGMPFGRHALHAKTLGFKHPASGEKMLFQSPLPKDLKKLIDDLREGKGS